MEAGPYQSPSRLQCVFQFVLLGTCELSSTFQTELAIDTNITVANTHMVVEDTHAVVADTQTAVTKIEKKVADMHRDVLAGREGASGQNNSVSTTGHPQTTYYLSCVRLKSG